MSSGNSNVKQKRTSIENANIKRPMMRLGKGVNIRIQQSALVHWSWVGCCQPSSPLTSNVSNDIKQRQQCPRLGRGGKFKNTTINISPLVVSLADTLWQVVNVNYLNQCWLSVLIVDSIWNPRNSEQSWWNQVDAWTSSANNSNNWHECSVDSCNHRDGKVHTRRVLGQNESTSGN